MNGTAESTPHLPRTREESSKNSVIWFLTATGCAFFAVDDISPLRALGGGLLASPSWVFITIAGWLASRKVRTLSSFQARFLAAIYIYGMVLTAVTLPLLQTEVLGESPLVKGLKFLTSVSIFILMMISGAVLSRVEPKAIQVGCAVAITLMAAGALAYHAGHPFLDQVNLLHSYENLQQRVRSTRFEASSLGAGLLVCLGLVFLFIPGRRAVLWFSIGLLGIATLAESRGTTLTVALALLTVPICLMLQRRSEWQTITTKQQLWTGAVALLAIVLSFRLDYFLSSPVWAAIGLKTEGTSDASRSMWADTSLGAIMQHPLGMGYAAYLEWLPQIIGSTTLTALDQFPLKDLSEMINQSIAASDATLSPKNLVGVSAVHLGLVGVFAVAVLYTATLRGALESTSRGFVSRIVVAGLVVIVTSTYYSSIFSFDQAFLFGALALGLSDRSSIIREAPGALS